MTLARRDGEVVIRVEGATLMSSRTHGSEEALARLGCQRLGGIAAPSVLVGGLGMGFTLRATLDALPRDARVVVAELLPAIVEWNRTVVSALARHPLRDGRVELAVEDVAAVVERSAETFDAVLLDVDNGPAAFTTGGNAALYGERGLATLRAAIRPGGTLAVWAVQQDRAFEARLRRAGFRVEVERVRARGERGGARHAIVVGVLPEEACA